MAHNGKTSLSDYDLSVMHEFEKQKVRKAIEKRLRRNKREEDERQAKAKKAQKLLKAHALTADVGMTGEPND